jgi:hypothetical protein
VTFIAYFVLLVSVALVVFMFTAASSKKERDYIILTILLLVDAIAGALLALNHLQVL